MSIKVKEKYRLEDGSIVPGTTTVTGDLGWNKGILINWANRLGLEGKDSAKYVDDKASIGQLAHTLILAELKAGMKEQGVNLGEYLKDYTENQINQAKNCLKSYYNWKKGKKIEPLVVEQPLVSEKYKYGGTPDFYGLIDGILTLVDYKTGKGIYSEYIIQVSAYTNLLVELGKEIKEVWILNIPRSDDESFSEKLISERELKVGWEIFLHLLAIYNLKGGIKPNG